MAKGLKPGEKVIMINCSEAEKYKLRVWTVRSEPWKLGHGAEVVLLEGKSGGFDTSCLQRVPPPKCSECTHKRFEKNNGGPNRYYCRHPEAIKDVGSRMICRTERHSEELTIKTSPEWCPKRKEADSE